MSMEGNPVNRCQKPKVLEALNHSLWLKKQQYMPPEEVKMFHPHIVSRVGVKMGTGVTQVDY